MARAPRLACLTGCRGPDSSRHSLQRLCRGPGGVRQSPLHRLGQAHTNPEVLGFDPHYKQPRREVAGKHGGAQQLARVALVGREALRRGAGKNPLAAQHVDRARRGAWVNPNPLALAGQVVGFQREVSAVAVVPALGLPTGCSCSAVSQFTASRDSRPHGAGGRLGGVLDHASAAAFSKK